MSDLNQELEDIADIAFTLEFSDPARYASGFAQLGKLKVLEDNVLPLAARFWATLNTVNALQKANDSFHTARLCSNEDYLGLSNELISYETHLKGHIATVTLMERRVKGILSLVRAFAVGPIP